MEVPPYLLRADVIYARKCDPDVRSSRQHVVRDSKNITIIEAAAIFHARIPIVRNGNDRQLFQAL